MPSLGPAEILVIFVVALLVFGPNKMPEITRQVGKGFREFRRVQQHLKSELRDVVAEFDAPTDATVDQQPVPMLPPKELGTEPPTPESPTSETSSSETPSSETPSPPMPPVADAPPPSPEPDATSDTA